MLHETHRALQAVCCFILMFTDSTECDNISEMLHSSLVRVVGSGWFECFSAKIHKIQDILVPVRTGFILVGTRRGHSWDPQVVLYHLSHLSGAGERIASRKKELLPAEEAWWKQPYGIAYHCRVIFHGSFIFLYSM